MTTSHSGADTGSTPPSVTGQPDIDPSAASVDISVPLRTEFAATLRVMTASIGADLGFSIDEIDDLKLAVSEVFTLLIDTDAATRAHASFLVLDDAVTVVMHRGLADDLVVLDDLAATILSSVIDEHRITTDGVRLVKRRATSDAR